MTKVLLFGAGRSSGDLINYLDKQGYSILVVDREEKDIDSKIVGTNNCNKQVCDVTKTDEKTIELMKELVQNANIVISLLDPSLHKIIAKLCVELNKNFATASFASNVQELEKEIKAKGLLFLNECGLDPGIDHMSAMKVIDEIKSQGGIIKLFHSYCGVLPVLNDVQSSKYLQGYKFFWAPRNVIDAGKGTAQIIKNGNPVFIPYHKLFANSHTVPVDGVGEFEGYYNRDTITYKDKYGLDDVEDMVRGTLRYSGYCKAWDVLLKLGLTEGNGAIANSNELTYIQFLKGFLGADFSAQNAKQKIEGYIGENIDQPTFDSIARTRIFSDKPITITKNGKLEDGSPADILQYLLDKEENWKPQPNDKDYVVMQHTFEYLLNSNKYRRTSILTLSGENASQTAIAKTVGIPLAIAVKNILNGTITGTGIVCPLTKDIYQPILNELENYGVHFKEKIEKIN